MGMGCGQEGGGVEREENEKIKQNKKFITISFRYLIKPNHF